MRDLQISMDACRGREDQVHVVLAQFLAQPAAHRNSETSLEAVEGSGRNQVGKGLPQQPLPAPAADSLMVGERIGEVEHLVVEIWNADLEAMRHGPLV